MTLGLIALQEVKDLFVECGYKVPAVKVTLGFTSKGLRSSTVVNAGRCSKASTSNVNHIFISPANTSSESIISTLIHECIHAIDNCEHGHGRNSKIALDIGFKLPMRSTPAGEELQTRIEKIVGRIGEYRDSTIATHQPRLRKPPARAICSNAVIQFR